MSRKDRGQRFEGWQSDDLGDQDREILQIALELCQRLDLKFRPEGVEWEDTYYASYLQRVYFDEPVIGRPNIILAKSMQGRLTPQEWKPLILSSLIYSKKLSRERNKNVAMSATPPIFLAFGALFSTIFLLQPDVIGKLVMVVAGFPIFIGLLIYSMFRGNLVYRSFRGRADRETAMILGRDLILNTLLKIDAMQLPSLEGEKMVEYAHRRLRQGMWRPNIGDRIALLRDDS